MATKVKTHKRKGRNKVSVVKEHSRKDGKKMKKGAGKEYENKKCDYSQCTKKQLKDCLTSGKSASKKKRAKQELECREEE